MRRTKKSEGVSEARGAALSIFFSDAVQKIGMCCESFPVYCRTCSRGVVWTLLVYCAALAMRVATHNVKLSGLCILAQTVALIWYGSLRVGFAYLVVVVVLAMFNFPEHSVSNNTFDGNEEELWASFNEL